MSSTSGIAPQQISGLASGLDTSAIISAMMAVASLPETAIKNQITVETARQNAYQSVLNELNTLTTSYQNLTDVSTWAPTQAVTSSNTGVLTATYTGGAAAGSYTIQVNSLAQANQYTSGGNTTAAAADTLKLTTNPPTGSPTETDITINAGDSLSTIASTINQTVGSPVYATILTDSSNVQHLVLSNKQTGTANAVTATIGGASGITFAQNQAAADASYSIVTNGVAGSPITSSTNTVTSQYAGLTLGLVSTGTATINVGAPTPNTTGITTALQSFVTEYNSVINDIENRLTEQPNPNPKTDADRTQGVLYNDQGLESLLSQLRNAFSDTITSTSSPANPYTSLSQVGLSTGAAVGTGTLNQDSINGLMTVDTTAFQNALTSNFDGVKALFTNATNDYDTEGLGQRLNTILTSYTNPAALNGYLGDAIASETSTISDLQSQVSDWDQRLALKQQMLESQFTAMETALAGVQSTSSQLTSQIGQLPTG